MMLRVTWTLTLFFIFFMWKSASAYALNSNTTNDSVVSHYVDENGIKVEKQIAKAVMVQSGIVSQTESYDESNDQWISNAEVDDDVNDSEEYDTKKEPGSKSSPSIFGSPGNIIDIFTALHSAWREVEKFREKNARMYTAQNQTLEEDRLRRDSSTSDAIEPLTPAPSTSVSEARYIKGDPLKGYYDFVITEGSYKFWAAFQLATAALVIYSTFAAIYYSKVNPIVGDYDYVDYLGGGRSLSDGHIDYVDPTVEGEKSSDVKTNENYQQAMGTTSTWSSLLQSGWTTKAGSTVRTIFDMIDKFTT